MYLDPSTIIAGVALIASVAFGVYSQLTAKASKQIAEKALQHSTSISWSVYTYLPEPEQEPGKLTPPPFDEDIVFCWQGIGSAPVKQVELHFSHDPQALNIIRNKITAYNPTTDSWITTTSGLSIFDFMELQESGEYVTIKWVDVTETHHSRTIKYSDMKQLDFKPTKLS